MSMAVPMAVGATERRTATISAFSMTRPGCSAPPAPTNRFDVIQDLELTTRSPKRPGFGRSSASHAGGSRTRYKVDGKINAGTSHQTKPVLHEQASRYQALSTANAGTSLDGAFHERRRLHEGMARFSS